LAKRIKILYATDGLGNGGKERQLIETIKHINKCKFEIGVITFNSNQYYSDQVKLISEYYTTYTKEKNILNPFFSIFESFEIFKPDIVHSYDLLSSMYTYIPSKIYRSKILNASIQDSGLDKGWQYAIKRYLLSLSDINISNSLKGFKYYKSNGEVLYNFIDQNRFSDVKHTDGFNIVMVANFTDYKDYSSYFKIVRELVNKELINKAYAVGSGKYLNKYKREIESDKILFDKVIFTGNISNVEELLAKINVGFLLSTEEYEEGISNSVLEYMASGVIPLVTDIGASSEIIDNEKDGFLIDKSDISVIVDIIKKLKADNNYKEELLINAQKKVAEKFCLVKNIQKLENLYLSINNS